MKRFAFLVLVFAAAVTAEGGIKEWTEHFETDEATTEMCLSAAETTEAEIQDMEKKLMGITEADINDETKKAYEKYNSFLVCMMEKAEMMIDSKLVVDKIMESLRKDQESFPIKEEIVKECMIAVNEDNNLSREDRAMGAAVCIVVGINKNK